jgi:hypothetical protein
LALSSRKTRSDYGGDEDRSKRSLITTAPESLSGALERVVREHNGSPGIIGHPGSEAINGGIVTSDKSVKT